MNKKNSSNTQKKYFKWTIKTVQMDKKVQMDIKIVQMDKKFVKMWQKNGSNEHKKNLAPPLAKICYLVYGHWNCKHRTQISHDTISTGCQWARINGL